MDFQTPKYAPVDPVATGDEGTSGARFGYRTGLASALSSSSESWMILRAGIAVLVPFLLELGGGLRISIYTRVSAWTTPTAEAFHNHLALTWIPICG